MPSRSYYCEECGHSYEEFFFSIAAPNPKKCPQCGAEYEVGFFQRFGSGVGYVYGEPKTFGQQAELNEKRLGKEQVQKMQEADPKCKKKSSPPWWRSGEIEGTKRREKPLDISKVKDVRKYVETGEMN